MPRTETHYRPLLFALLQQLNNRFSSRGHFLPSSHDEEEHDDENDGGSYSNRAWIHCRWGWAR
jgi:hypothetical protein